jgi:hypothetical protein
MTVRKNYITDCMISRRAARWVLRPRAGPPVDAGPHCGIGGDAIGASKPCTSPASPAHSAGRSSLSIPRSVPHTDVERSSLLLEKRTDHFN